MITIKQLLSLDIIKPGQNVDGGVNPPVAQRPKSGSVERGGRVGGVGTDRVQTDRQTDELTDALLVGHCLKWMLTDKRCITTQTGMCLRVHV